MIKKKSNMKFNESNSKQKIKLSWEQEIYYCWRSGINKIKKNVIMVIYCWRKYDIHFNNFMYRVSPASWATPIPYCIHSVISEIMSPALGPQIVAPRISSVPARTYTFYFYFIIPFLFFVFCFLLFIYHVENISLSK